MGKGSWKTSLAFAMQRFKNNIQHRISVRAMGKATNMTSKTHYAIFVKREGVWWTEIKLFFFFFKDHCANRQNFPLRSTFLLVFCLCNEKVGKV